MREKILQILRELEIRDYRITENENESAELFFVKKKLDMRRMKDVRKASVTVFREIEKEGRKLLGTSTAYLIPGLSDEEIRGYLAEAYAAAEFTGNPYYELYEGKKYPMVPDQSDLSQKTLPEAAALMSKALFKADTKDDAFINSAEIFIVKNTRTIYSSRGVDAAYEKFSVKGEFIAQCKMPKDVEQYYDFKYEGLEAEALEGKVREALDTVRDRARAEKAPKGGSYDIILTGEHVRTILDFYMMRAEGAYVYAGYSDWKPGMDVQGDGVKGEKLNIVAVPEAPFTEEGIPVTERDFVKDGKLCFTPANTRFARYLGVEPTGSYERIRLENGTVPFDEMKKGCLYPVSFSDFQMDPFSGHFGGEIRLAYLYTDHGVEILSGGSINGNLIDKQGDLVFSLEKYTDATYSEPKAVLLKSVPVAG